MQLIKISDHSVKANRAKQSQRNDNLNKSPTTSNTAQNMNAISTSPIAGKQSVVFKDFVKYVQKTGKIVARKMPDYKEVLKCPEYRNFDIRKSLNVEIRE